MSITAEPAQRPLDPIGGHVYTVPVVREIRVAMPARCWDEIW
jgi:hypothetical protein